MRFGKKTILKMVLLWVGVIAITAGAGIGIGVGFGKSMGYSFSNDAFSTKYYASNYQVEYIMNDLGVDSSYMKSEDGEFFRLAHNEGVPIPVVFEDEFDQGTRDIVIKALDYTFDLIQDINPLYSYVLVDAQEFANRGKGVNGIEYSIKSQSELSDESVVAQADLAQINYKTNRIVDGEISVSRERLAKLSEDSLYHSMLHELMHLLGSNDVYLDTQENPNNTIYHNTIMRTEGKDNLNCHKNFSPNDYNIFLAIYSPECETQEELDSIIELCREKSINYRDKYYKDFADETKSKVGFSKLEYGDCTKIQDLKITRQHKMNGEYITSVIEIHGDTFKIECESDTGVFKDKLVCTGKVLKYTDCIVLSEVYMSKSYLHKDNSPFRGSIVLFYVGGESSTMVVDLYDVFHGRYTEVEISTTQENIFETATDEVSKVVNN